MYTPSVLEGERKASSGPLELDYRQSLATMRVLGTEGLLLEQPVLLTSGSSLHPPHSFSFNSGWKGTAYKKVSFGILALFSSPYSAVSGRGVSHWVTTPLTLSLSGNTAGKRQGSKLGRL